MAIDIPSLFRDVIETPEQRQRRKLSEAVALAPQARGGIASLLNPLAQATSVNLQQGSEGLGRSVGGMLGLDMRDTGEKVSDQLLGADLSDAQGMRDLSKAISQYAPVQAMGLLQAADEKDLQEAQLERDLEDRDQARELRQIQIDQANLAKTAQNANARYRAVVAGMIGTDSKFANFKQGILDGFVPMERVSEIVDALGEDEPKESFTPIGVRDGGQTFTALWNGSDTFKTPDMIDIELTKNAQLFDLPSVQVEGDDYFRSETRETDRDNRFLSTQNFVTTVNQAIDFYSENPSANTLAASFSGKVSDLAANIEPLKDIFLSNGKKLLSADLFNVENYESPSSEDESLPTFKSLGIQDARAKTIALNLALQYAAAIGLGSGRALTDRDVRLAMQAVGSGLQDKDRIISSLSEAKNQVTGRYNTYRSQFDPSQTKEITDTKAKIDVNQFLTPKN
jgi:hypothetical protein